MTQLTLYYAPRTRSFTALWLLEELGLPYTLEAFSLATGRHKQPDFLALNPMGKVPVVVRDGVAMSEAAAIAIALADLHPEAGLGVGIDDPLRPAWLRWHFFAAAIIEPALMERFTGATPNPRTYAWGSFDEMVRVATAGVQDGWLLGERFTSADIITGAGLDFGIKFGAIAKEGAIAEYVARLRARPAYQRALAIEAEQVARLLPG
ncbi:MAG: glutathione S-transferase [Deltaproteobacteria bacterium]|nr:glutathione S-transferase [Deltaproteobacteria bacterium]